MQRGTVPWPWSFTLYAGNICHEQELSAMIKSTVNQFSELHFGPDKYVMLYSAKSKGRCDG
jgi:hypothetical protein